ncbi:MAG: HYR domain-containing protein, partial [Acidimicrobiia bacterium]|nr:HYR domain-containing protein [Acidimicrobiia bacterium]
DFTIFDAFGDGICCGFGEGSYEVLFDGEVVGSGAEFGDSETTANIGGGCPCEGDEITVSILFDDFPGETSFEIRDASTGKVVASGDGFTEPGGTFEESYCLPEGCYVFEIFDAFGDGICCGFGEGAYSVSLNGEVVASGGEFDDSEATELGSTCVCEGDIARIEILTDDFGEETTYELVDNDSGEVVAAGGPFESNTLNIDEVCVDSDGCYTFTIFDAFGDGICCGFGEGSYRVLLNGVIQGAGGEFADSESTELGGGCPAGDPTLALTLDSECVAPGEEITVELSMLDLGGLPIAGYQAFLAYDPAEVEFISATYTDDPFGEHIIMGDDINPEPGLLLLAAGVDLLAGQPDSAADSLLATLTFVVAESGACTVAGPPVVFSDDFPHPSRLTDRAGTDIMPSLVDAPSLADTTPPDVSDCPGDIATIADAGGCDAAIEWTAPSVSDNCDEAPSLVYCIDLDDDGTIDVADLADPAAVFPAGTHRVIAKATDACDNVNDDCSFLVTVEAVNELLVSVELSPTVDSPLDRCITLSLHTCGGDVVESRHQLSFTGGVAAELSLLVPCGDYQCITARDELHTLAATDEDDFGIDGLSYVADFTNTGGDNDWLVGGDLNDDGVIEILDFGIFIDKLSQFVDPSDCDTVGPHADINGNGLVFTEDFSFIQINFLDEDDTPCCAPSGLAGPIDQGPRTRISVEELYARGLGHLEVADLNHDGWVDTDDMQAFASGARPSKRFLAPSRGAFGQ